MSEQIEGIDFAVAAYREEGEWQVVELVHDVLSDVERLSAALRRFPGDGGAIGLVAIDEDFFLIVRVAGPDVRLLLSDITAADEWELARSAVDQLGVAGGVTVTLAHVVPPRDHRAGRVEHDRPDRYVAGIHGRARLDERGAHRRVVRRHRVRQT